MKVLMMILLTILISGCGNTQIEKSSRAMGTILELKAEGFGAEAAVEESFARVAELEKNILADTKKIEAAAGNGDFVKINREVFEILKIAQDISILTDGAFDVTIGAAVDLWKVARTNLKFPAEEEISVAQELVNYRNLELREEDYSARLKIAGMKINLGGCAKGYAVDVVKKIFDEHNISDGLINFGTSTIYAIGEKEIGLKNPRAENELAEIIKIRDSALSTSGDYINFAIIDGRRYHHILNPKTCLPVETAIASVSVTVDGRVENCSTIADILSTTVFIIGEARAEEIISNIGFPESVKITIFIDS